MSLATIFYDDPFFTVADFNRLFDAAWDRRVTPSTTNSTNEVQAVEESQSFTPRMDLHESKDKNELTATFELPGMKKEDVSIDVHNNRLLVSGKTSLSNDLEKEGYLRRERRFGKFSRVLPLPNGTSAANIKASMENGVLTVKFPKTQPDQEPKKVTIA